MGVMKEMHAEIINKLAIFITGKILKQPGRKLSEDEHLISSGLIDSFSLVDISLFVEEEFNVQIDDTELNAETFDTLNELANLITRRQH